MSGRFAKISLLSLVLVLIVIAGTIAFMTGTSAGRSSLAGMVSQALSNDQRRIGIGSVSGIWSGNLSISHVVVEDGNEAWLLVKDIEVYWSPLSLLSGSFEAELIRAGRLEIARPPPASGGDTSQGAFSLPLRLDIRDIELPKILVGDSLAGGIAQLEANATLVADTSPIRIETEAHLRRTDGTEGALDAKVVYHPEGDRLELELKGAEPGDGILVNLLGIAGKPRVDLLINGSGPVADWNGVATLALDGTERAKVTAALSEDQNGRQISADGSGAFDLILPQPYADLVHGGASFEVIVRADNGGAYAIDRARLSSSSLVAEASGTYDPNGASDIRLTARGADGPVRVVLDDDAGATRLELRSLNATVTGSGRKLALLAEADAASINMPGVSLAGIRARLSSDGFDPSIVSGSFDISASADDLQSSNANLQQLTGGPVSISISGEADDGELALEQVALEARHLNARVSGIAAADFARFDLKSHIEILRAGLPGAVGSLAGEKLVADVQLSRGPAGAISVNEMTLSGATLRVKGEGRLDGDGLQSSISGEISSLARANEKLTGALSFTATASGSVSAPEFTFKAQSDAVTAIGKSIKDLAFVAEGIANSDAPSADVRLSGSIDGATIDGAATLSTNDRQKLIEDLRIAIGENAIEGNLLLDAGFRPTGVLSIAVPNLSQMAALALQEVEGDLKGSAEFFIVADVPMLNVRLASSKIQSGEIAAERVNIDGLVENYLAKPNLSGKIGIARILSGKTEVRKLTVDLERDGEWTAFSGSAQVDGNPATLSGSVRAGDNGTTVRLASGDAYLQGLRLGLASLSEIDVRNGVAEIGQLALAVGGGKVDIEGSAGENLALKARLTGVSAAVANAFAPELGASGSVSGVVSVSGAATAPEIAYDLSIANASVAQSRAAGLKGFAVKSDGRFINNTLNFQAALSGAAGLSLSSGGSVRTGGTPVLDIKIDGSIPLGLASANVAAQGIKLEGAARVDLSLSGSSSLPNIAGTISTTGARFIDARSGIAINNIKADIGLASDRATIRAMRGDLSTGGSLAATGTVGIRVQDGLPADLAITVRNARYTDGELIQADLGGDLTLKGPILSGATLGGVMNFEKVSITLPDTLPTTLTRLDVKHKNAPERVRRQAEALQSDDGANGSSAGLGLDLTLNAPGRIFIRGRGLDAELGGSLRLTGSTGSPRAVGTFELRRGRLSILGKRLDLTRGRIGFENSLIPFIDFIAQAVVSDGTVSVVVTGSASNPKFSFQSSSSAPEDEALAQLIFDRSLSDLSPLQIAQLAEAVAQLSGVSGSTSLLDRLRSRIGVDDIDVKTDGETGDTSVAVGKYLNDRTYLSIEKGSKAGSGKATIDLSIGRGLKLRGQASDSGETKGGIFFERDY